MSTALFTLYVDSAKNLPVRELSYIKLFINIYLND